MGFWEILGYKYLKMWSLQFAPCCWSFGTRTERKHYIDYTISTFSTVAEWKWVTKRGICPFLCLVLILLNLGKFTSYSNRELGSNLRKLSLGELLWAYDASFALVSWGTEPRSTCHEDSFNVQTALHILHPRFPPFISPHLLHLTKWFPVFTVH